MIRILLVMVVLGSLAVSEPVSEKPCVLSHALAIDYTNYMCTKSFEMTAESNERAVSSTSSVSEALRYSNNNGWGTIARKGEVITMSFTLQDNCSDKWEIITINFKTTSAMVVHLQADQTKKYSWTFHDYSGVTHVSTEVKKTVDGNAFQLVFETAPGVLIVADLYVTLFCKCTSVRCPVGFTYLPAADSCFKIIFDKYNWTAAGEQCRDLFPGSDLAAIATDDENKAIKIFVALEVANNGNHDACMVADKSAGKLLWVGGQRAKDDDCGTPFVWKGLNGEMMALNFSDWKEEEPNCKNDDEFCVHLWSVFGYRWNDLRCQAEFCSLCQYNP